MLYDCLPDDLVVLGPFFHRLLDELVLHVAPLDPLGISTGGLLEPDDVMV